MTVQGIRGVVEAAIQRASLATGVDFSFLMKTAGRESGMNPSAKAGTSSAAGLFQFTEQTWLSTLKQHGAKHGYARYADLVEKGSDGRYHVPAGDARRAGLRADAPVEVLLDRERFSVAGLEDGGVDREGAGAVTLDEVQKPLDRVLSRLDRNGDGVIDKADFQRHRPWGKGPGGPGGAGGPGEPPAPPAQQQQ